MSMSYHYLAWLCELAYTGVAAGRHGWGACPKPDQSGSWNFIYLFIYDATRTIALSALFAANPRLVHYQIISSSLEI